jgi:hypothetical protein
VHAALLTNNDTKILIDGKELAIDYVFIERMCSTI